VAGVAGGAGIGGRARPGLRAMLAGGQSGMLVFGLTPPRRSASPEQMREIAAKSMVSDYFYACRDRQQPPRPVLFTLSVCGSDKTLAFLKWLGVDVPRWLDNELRHATDTLGESYGQCLATARELITFCRRLGLPFGFSVESMSIRKAEIQASIALAAELRGLLGPR
jgi:hypothetical protein